MCVTIWADENCLWEYYFYLYEILIQNFNLCAPFAKRLSLNLCSKPFLLYNTFKTKILTERFRLWNRFFVNCFIITSRETKYLKEISISMNSIIEPNNSRVNTSPTFYCVSQEIFKFLNVDFKIFIEYV